MRREAPILGLVALFAACTTSARPTPPSAPPILPLRSCEDGSGTPKPRVSLGPDVNVEVMCGTTVTVPFASITNDGLNFIRWTTTIEGSPAFILDDKLPHEACNDGTTQVPAATLQPLTGAVPGDTYDAIVTITFANDVFPAGQVKLHAVVATPRFTITPSRIDFGTVAALAMPPRARIVFHNDSNGSTFVASSSVAAPFTLFFAANLFTSGTATNGDIGLIATIAGEYATTATWTVAPALGVPEACLAHATAELHATVVGGDGGVD